MNSADDEGEKMMKNKVVVKTSQSWDFIQFHINLQISKTVRQSFDWPYRESCDRYLNEVGDQGSALVKRLLSVNGVERVAIERYMVSVTLGTAFDEEYVGKRALAQIVGFLQIKEIEGPEWAIGIKDETPTLEIPPRAKIG